MAGRRFSIKDYFDTRCAETQPLFAFDARSEVEARRWRARALAKVRDLLGEMPQPVQLHTDIIESVDMGSYVREKFVFDADALSSVPGYILIPMHVPRPAPALLCLHGHGPGKDPVAGVTTADEFCSEDDKRRSLEQHNYDYARQFAERGYVTITFDYRCFGERRETGISLWGRDPCNVHFIRGSLLGINLLALDIHDTSRAIDYLLERPEVDRDRIGCVGLSFGGTMTMWTTAMDRRIKAAVISGYVCEFESFAMQLGSVCGSQFVPTLRRYFDVPDIAALIAPRPLLIESGTADEVFPIESADRAYERVKAAYRAWGTSDRLARDVFGGGHVFHGPAAYEWFDRWL